MIRLKLILCFAILSTIQCNVEEKFVPIRNKNGYMRCTNEDKPVCGATKTNIRGKGTEYQTFGNECEFKEHNRMFGNKWYLANDGVCPNCPTCPDEEKPVCHSMGPGLNNNKAFLNACFVDRYKCLHGVLSVSFIMNEGRCQICKKKGHYDHPDDPQWEDYIRRNVAWQTITTGCVDDE